MLKYGAWLKEEAHKGRFHYLPLDVILRKLRTAGFERRSSIESAFRVKRSCCVRRLTPLTTKKECVEPAQGIRFESPLAL